VLAAVDAQRALADHEWPQGADLRVRIGLHTGEGRLGGDNYLGLDVHRGARIGGVGHGAQILLSGSTRALVAGDLPEGVGLRDLGEHRLKDLSRVESIHQLVVPGLPADFPPLKSLDARPNNLPVQLTGFIGRGRELEELRGLLKETRLLTLTGAGGTGKTRLSIQLAAQESDDFADGMFFVPLTTVSDPEEVPDAIAEVLTLKETSRDTSTPMRRIIDYLRGKCMLLVLDNFEHVLDAAPRVTEILKSVEEVKVIVTSRSPLRAYGEIDFAVPPLLLPDAENLPDIESLSQYEAVALFVQRAVAVKPDFTITNENAPAVAEICARLDGLPLAIELAAARVRVLSPQALLDRLGERLRMLVGGSRDLPARQQTLRQAIEWSYDLLDDLEKNLFGILGTFMGSFALDEIERVRGSDASDVDILDVLTALVEKSLVRSVDESAEARFDMLETMREYAIEKLDQREDAEALRRRHAEVYTELAERAAGELHTISQRQWLDRLERDHGNLRAALNWTIRDRERAIALRLSTALWRFWQMRGHLQEGRRRIEAALPLCAPDDRSELRARALQAAGGIAYWQGELKGMTGYYEEAVELWRELGDDAGLAGALYDAAIGNDWAQMADKKPLVDESLALYRRIGDRHGEARARWGVGTIHYFTEDYAEAEAEFTASLDVFTEVGDVFMMLWALYELGEVALATEEHDRARKYFRDALRLGADAGDVSAILVVVDAFATLALQEGQPDRAVRLRAAVTKIKTATGTELVDVWKEIIGAEILERDDFNEERLQEIWAEGERMSLQEVIDCALEDEQLSGP
jgi:predicted ATPase